MIGIIDTKISNLGSIKRWLNILNLEYCIIESDEDFIKLNLVVFPGVGSWDTVANFLKTSKLESPLRKYINDGGKYLGICLGFQILFSESDEGKLDGLAIFPEKISKINKYKNVILPHVGFNDLTFNTNPFSNDIINKSFYFTHSFGLLEFQNNENTVIAETEYQGVKIITFIEYKNIIACQFHPEKSSTAGISFLKKIIEWSKKD